MRLPRCALARLRIAFLCPAKARYALGIKSEDRTSGERDPIRPRLGNYGPGDRHSRELPRVVPAKAPYARDQDRYAPGIKSKDHPLVTSATLAKFAPEDLRNAIFVLIFTDCGNFDRLDLLSEFPLAARRGEGLRVPRLADHWGPHRYFLTPCAHLAGLVPPRSRIPQDAPETRLPASSDARSAATACDAAMRAAAPAGAACSVANGLS